MLCKRISKIIINRMKNIVHCLVSSKQGAFVPGRNISNNIMIAQEVFHSMNKMSNRNALMVIKADMEKIYDKVSWRYLRIVLEHYDFHFKYIRWTMCYVHKPTFLVLINGQPSTWFSSIVGL